MADKLPRKVTLTSAFKRDIKKQYLTLASVEWAEVLQCLANDQPLPPKYLDHALKGDMVAFRECHVKPDLLLVYKIGDNGVLELYRLASHSELF
ncbi:MULTISPECIES: type II toxin-antitoxin system YafQ family toxin [unclassified Moraxella]|uniref:type II toxin-antitoxin system YafQ family toxin n=1 Tax=unclassified Moraxella TaxID=2685852 RepID=UPI003AF81B97